MSYYNAKVKIATDGPKGQLKWQTESYLIDAVSITHAEQKINEDFESAGVEFEVKSVSESRIVKIIN
jgi:hypothetical protein